MKINLLVIRSNNLKAIAEQYTTLGLKFDYHQHGNGPFHYSCELNDFVFEIYPASANYPVDSSIRLGFSIPVNEYKRSNIENVWKIIAPLSKTEWGDQLVLEDLDGRKVVLTISG